MLVHFIQSTNEFFQVELNRVYGYRVPRRGQSIRLGGDARHSLGAAQLADLNDDARPGRLYSGPNGRHQYINDEIPADEI